MNCSHALKQLRIKGFLSQTDLAKKLRVSCVLVNRWENGKNAPSYIAQRKITSPCKKYIVIIDQFGEVK
jgi:DNA-binding transcriptional regulator YiaG